jgi:hypothetical protein
MGQFGSAPHEELLYMSRSRFGEKYKLWFYQNGFNFSIFLVKNGFSRKTLVLYVRCVHMISASTRSCN